MLQRPLIVVSLEGLSRSALGCYGCSWNRTPAIDAIAAGGTIWDRWIATRDDDRELFSTWFDPESSTSGNLRWLDSWRQRGPTHFLSDSPSWQSLAEAGFDSVRSVPRPGHQQPVGPDDVAETQFGRLVAAAVDRDQQEEPWSVLWLHSNFLTSCWDAPRDLFPLDDIDAEIDEPQDPELAAWQESDDIETVERLPWTFDTVSPPEELLTEESHPDLLTTWMRTYACQVRLVDLLLEVLLQSLSVEDPWLVLLGTSGFHFGQDRWIGHRGRSLRSADIHLPLLISDSGPLRVPHLTSTDELPELLGRLAETQPLALPQQWARPTSLAQQDASPDDQREMVCVETASHRAAWVTTTPQWFYLQEDSGEEHLFLKPDDVDDFNDVARVRPDVTSQLRERKK